MASIPDQTRAAALVASVILTAGMFAGFAFGATATPATRDTAPLLLQSTSLVRHEPRPDCKGTVTARQAHAPAAPDEARAEGV
jgi:hypothetical protein